MEIILLEKVKKLGDLGDRVKVKPGYGRNFLIPYQKAVAATKANIAAFEARRADLEKKAADALSAAKKRSEQLSAIIVNLAENASDEGKLYGSVGTVELARAITDAGVEVEKREILLPNGAIHAVGEYEVDLQLHSDVIASVKVVITAAK